MLLRCYSGFTFLNVFKWVWKQMSIPFLSVFWRVCRPTRTFYMQSLSILTTKQPVKWCLYSVAANNVDDPKRLKSSISPGFDHLFISLQHMRIQKIWMKFLIIPWCIYSKLTVNVTVYLFCDTVPVLKSANVLRHVCWYFSAHQTFTSFTSWCADAGHIRAQSSSIIGSFVNILGAILCF